MHILVAQVLLFIAGHTILKKYLITSAEAKHWKQRLYYRRK